METNQEAISINQLGKDVSIDQLTELSLLTHLIAHGEWLWRDEKIQSLSLFDLCWELMGNERVVDEHEYDSVCSKEDYEEITELSSSIMSVLGKINRVGGKITEEDTDAMMDYLFAQDHSLLIMDTFYGVAENVLSMAKEFCSSEDREALEAKNRKKGHSFVDRAGREGICSLMYAGYDSRWEITSRTEYAKWAINNRNKTNRWILKSLFWMWPKFSGNSLYPIQAVSQESQGPYYDFRETDNMWDQNTQYGRDRMELMEFITSKAKEFQGDPVWLRALLTGDKKTLGANHE